MKKRLYVILLIIIGIVAIFAYYIYSQIFNRFDYDTVLEIEKNVPVMKSLSQLPKSNSLPFKIYLKYRNSGRGIKAGEYEIKGEYNLEEIMNILESGKGKMVKITIPEGFSVKQIAELLEATGNIDKDKFYSALNDAAKKFPYKIPDGNFEGFLYPETYFLPEKYDEKVVVNAMLGQLLKKFPYEKYGNREDFYEKLIMASILEREAKLKEEKPVMASVFYNRIKKGMTLSSDATVNFVYDYKKKRMYYKDLKIDSPYNTYKYKSLPPGPICNPTVDSVDAAYNPSNTDYLFFVAKGDGGHYFSKTYREHLKFQNENK